MPNIALELGKQAASFGVSGIYGEQQDVDGIKIIPVALASSGFGGGSYSGNGAGPSQIRRGRWLIIEQATLFALATSETVISLLRTREQLAVVQLLKVQGAFRI